MTRPHSRLDAHFVAGFFQQRQIEISVQLAFNQRPPDTALVGCSINKYGRVASTSLAQVHGGSSVACQKQPAMVSFWVERHRRAVEIVDILGAKRRAESKANLQEHDADFGEVSGPQRAPQEG